MRKPLITLATIVVLIAIGIIFKTPILQSFSNFLMKQDPPEKADIMVVLSGGAFDRGNEGANLYKGGYAKRIICPGGNLEEILLALGDTMYESDVCKRNIVRNGIPDSLISVIHYGTSTREEADTILGYCKEHQIKKIIGVQLQTSGYYPGLNLTELIQLFGGLYNQSVKPLELLDTVWVLRTTWPSGS